MTRPYDHEAEAVGPRRAAASSPAPPTDGALALEWVDVPPPRRPGRPGPRLLDVGASDSVPRMAWPEAPGLAARAALRERERARLRRARRLAALTVAAAVALVILLVTAFGPSGDRLVGAAGPAPAHRLLPSGPPRPQVVAMHDTLRIQLPVNQARVTAIGYHGAGDTARPLEPVGSQANAGAFGRIVQRIVGDDGSGLRYYLLEGGAGPRTGGLDIGAPEGTDVYAPVDGTVIAISERIVNGRPYGRNIEVQPAGNPGFVVSLTNLELDPALTVGSSVVAARTKIGRVIDLSEVERAGLARYTHDRGQHVHIEVRFAASLAAP
jgi:hypothetical protein